MKNTLLPVHGFVLAGGKSTRMGTDKASLRFRGRPLVEIAIKKLRGFCEDVGIAGNRDDLAEYATVVHETRNDIGPAAGIEAGLSAATQPWVLFIPVDVPLVPMELLRGWLETLGKEQSVGCGASYLLVNRERQPAFCAMRRTCLPSVTAALDRGERRLANLLKTIEDDDRAGWLWACEASRFVPKATAMHLEDMSLDVEHWFVNMNTPEELAEVESWAVDADTESGKKKSSVFRG